MSKRRVTCDVPGYGCGTCPDFDSRRQSAIPAKTEAGYQRALIEMTNCWELQKDRADIAEAALTASKAREKLLADIRRAAADVWRHTSEEGGIAHNEDEIDELARVLNIADIYDQDRKEPTHAEVLAHPACAAVVAERDEVIATRARAIEAMGKASDALLDVECERDRLVVLLRAAVVGKLAGPWERDTSKGGCGWRSNKQRRVFPKGPSIMSAGFQDDDPAFSPGVGPRGDTPGTQADADAWLIAHDWTLMTPADQALLGRGGE